MPKQFQPAMCLKMKYIKLLALISILTVSQLSAGGYFSKPQNQQTHSGGQFSPTDFLDPLYCPDAEEATLFADALFSTTQQQRLGAINKIEQILKISEDPCIPTQQHNEAIVFLNVIIQRIAATQILNENDSILRTNIQRSSLEWLDRPRELSWLQTHAAQWLKNLTRPSDICSVLPQQREVTIKKIMICINFCEETVSRTLIDEATGEKITKALTSINELIEILFHKKHNPELDFEVRQTLLALEKKLTARFMEWLATSSARFQLLRFQAKLWLTRLFGDEFPN